MTKTAVETPVVGEKVGLRLTLMILVILIALGSLVVLHYRRRYFWPYCELMSLLDIMCGLSLAGAVPLGPFRTRWSLWWRQGMHWLGFLVLVYLVHDLLYLGVLSHQMAGLCLLGLSGFVFYFSGLYIDPLLILVGVVCLSMAASMVWLHQHIWLLVLPICILALLLVVLVAHRRQ